MKAIVVSVLIAFCFSTITKAQTPPATAETIMSDAYKAAAKENKNILLIFHASWCGWCHKMDKSMNDGDCKKYFDDNYITVHLTVDDKKELDNPGADEFKKKYFGDGQGLPFWLVFDKDANMLANSRMKKEGDAPGSGSNTGCPASEEEVNYFIAVLKKTSHLNDDQLSKIHKRFRKNED